LTAALTLAIKVLVMRVHEQSCNIVEGVGQISPQTDGLGTLFPHFRDPIGTFFQPTVTVENPADSIANVAATIRRPTSTIFSLAGSIFFLDANIISRAGTIIFLAETILFPTLSILRRNQSFFLNPQPKTLKT
jgi:hypothetical protein